MNDKKLVYGLVNEEYGTLYCESLDDLLEQIRIEIEANALVGFDHELKIVYTEMTQAEIDAMPEADWL